VESRLRLVLVDVMVFRLLVVAVDHGDEDGAPIVGCGS
jgi:hypothetical protein